MWCQKCFPLLKGEGVPLTKIFFPVWRCIKPNLLSKMFPFTRRGVPWTKNLFQCEHVSSQIWCQKFFPLLKGGRGFPWQKYFFQSEDVSSQICCQKCFPLLGGVPQEKIIFQCEHVSSQICCQKIFPLMVEGGSLNKIFFSSLNMYQAKSGVKNTSLYWGGLDKKFYFQSEHVSSQIWYQKFPL